MLLLLVSILAIGAISCSATTIPSASVTENKTPSSPTLATPSPTSSGFPHPASPASNPSAFPKPVSTLSLNQTDAGKTLQVPAGEIVLITLSENPTTGYRWALEPMEQPVLELQASDYVTASGAGIGGGGQRVFKFRTKASGTVNLQLKEWRDWEGEQSTLNRFSVTIKVP
ncbi:MAG: protease inhibitor I42 family protein [Kovacikia sp.]